MNKANECTCPSGDGSLVHPCPAHPAVEQADVAAKLTFINGRPAMCGCQVEYSDGGGEYSDVIYVTLCAKHSGSAILDLVATNRIALTPEYEGQWHADLYLDREIPLAKVEGATPAEAVLALMSAERIDPEQESVEQAGGDEHVSLRGAANLAFNALHECVPAGGAEKQYSDAIRALETALRDIAYSVNRTATPQQFSDHLQREARAALAQPSPAQAEQAEAERPEMSPERAAYFMRRFKSEEKLLGPNEQAAVDYVLSLLAQHDRIVGELRAEIAKLSEALDECDGDRWKLRSERDSALARVAELETKLAELEKQEPAGWLAYHFGGKRQGTVYGGPCDTKEEIERYIQQVERSDDSITLQGKPFYAAPAAQAQHSVPGDIMRDAQRYRWLRDQQFYFSFSTENSDAGISSCTAGMSSRFKNLSWVDAAIDSAIAAAPGKEVGHE